MSETAKSFWHSAGYIPWFTADTASAVGAALRALAISLLGYAVSGSTIAAGWLGTSSMIAQQVASVFGGTFVDRHDRKRLIVANAVVGVLAWGAIAVLLLCGALSFPVLLLIAVLASGINGFLGSATDAMLRSIIDIRYYPKARSLNEGRDATIAMAGSPIGGFLYSIAPWLPFLASACMYAVAGVAATGIREYGSDGGVYRGTGWRCSERRFLPRFPGRLVMVAASENAGGRAHRGGIGQFRRQWHPICHPAAFGVVRDQCDLHRIHQWRHIADDACGIVAGRQTQR